MPIPLVQSGILLQPKKYGFLIPFRLASETKKPGDKSLYRYSGFQDLQDVREIQRGDLLRKVLVESKKISDKNGERHAVADAWAHEKEPFATGQPPDTAGNAGICCCLMDCFFVHP